MDSVFEMAKKVKCKRDVVGRLVLVFGAWQCGLPWGGVESLCLNVPKLERVIGST